MAAGNLQNDLQQSKQITLQETVFCQISVMNFGWALRAEAASWVTCREVQLL